MHAFKWDGTSQPLHGAHSDRQVYVHRRHGKNAGDVNFDPNNARRLLYTKTATNFVVGVSQHSACMICSGKDTTKLEVAQVAATDNYVSRRRTYEMGTRNNIRW